MPQRTAKKSAATSRAKKNSKSNPKIPANLNFCKTDEVTTIEKIAVQLREEVIKMLVEAGSGHSAGSLGTAEIFAALYFNVLNIDPKNPRATDRDRFVLSNGHICPIWYATLAYRGYFPKTELTTLRNLNSRLQGHPHFFSPRPNASKTPKATENENKDFLHLTDLSVRTGYTQTAHEKSVARNHLLTYPLPGIENTSGSLGQGLSQAIGMALAAKLNTQTHRIYCMTGDGELNEGQNWEAAMYAGNKKLHNLTWIIDRNNIQQHGYTEQLMPLEPLRQKLEAFNWYVLEVDGHNVEEIINSCNMAKTIFERPSVIIAHTTPGKGVDFMEYKFEWHSKPPNKVQAEKALAQLRTLEGRIKCL